MDQRGQHRRAVIAGLGMTDMGKIYGRTSAQLAGEAIRLAVKDAGLRLSDVDGLLTNTGLYGGTDMYAGKDIGLRDLRLQSQVQAFGSSAGVMVQYAALAVESGAADAIVCVFSDTPLHPGERTGASYSGKGRVSGGIPAIGYATGMRGAPTMYAMAARRHMLTYGTTSQQLGAVAVAARQWAAMNPQAQFRQTLTLEEHQDSRVVADPFHLFDCCTVSNGGIAILITTADRATDLAQPSVHLWGWGQAHPGRLHARGSNFGLEGPGRESSTSALSMAGITVDDIDIAQLYDCFTFTTLLTLEDYGFCPRGEGGPFVASGAIAPGGSLPVNTGGGQLSSYYMWGMTPLSEGIIQARGHGGDRQVAKNDLIAVSGNGGYMDFHSTLVLSPHDPKE